MMLILVSFWVWKMAGFAGCKGQEVLPFVKSSPSCVALFGIALTTTPGELRGLLCYSS